jgi:Fur family ferric uptake transcriptional regulator
MCHHCDYAWLLESAGLAPTAKRRMVLEVIGGNTAPLSARQIYDTLRRHCGINRVTVYRILDLLVEKGVVERLSGGGRAFFYGLAPNEHHRPHPHFYCKTCGLLECLSPESLSLDTSALKRIYPGVIESVAVRVDGVCKNCLKNL